MQIGVFLLGELWLFSQEPARSRRRSQVLLRLVLLMGMPFCRCDVTTDNDWQIVIYTGLTMPKETA
jgi:hypothetical protein